jgi:ribosome-associated translation inhibitor RaiA
LENLHSNDSFDPVCDKLAKKYSKLKLKISKSAKDVKLKENLHKFYKLQCLGSIRSHVD